MVLQSGAVRTFSIVPTLFAATTLLSTAACWDFDADFDHWCERNGCEDAGLQPDGGGSDAGAGADAGDDGGTDAGPPCLDPASFEGGWEPLVSDAGPATWSEYQANDVATQIRIYDAGSGPVRDGMFAAHFSVKPNQLHTLSGEERAIARWNDAGETEGDEYFYGFSMRFPDGGFSGYEPRTLVRWSTPGQPGPVELRGNGEGLHLRAGISGDQVTVIPVVKANAWYDVVMHVRWSTDPAVGSAHIDYREGTTGAFVDGGTVFGRTLYGDAMAPAPVDLYLGITRTPALNNPSADQVIYDGFRRAASFCGAQPR